MRPRVTLFVSSAPELRSGDHLLVKASRALALETIVGALVAT